MFFKKINKRIIKGRRKNKDGYILLISVLIVSAVALSVSTSVVLLGVDESQSQFSLENGKQALNLAHGCAEESLEEIKDNSSYTGSTTINSFGSGSCEYNVIDTGGDSREIRIIGFVDDYIKKVKLNLTDVSPITIESWGEVQEF